MPRTRRIDHGAKLARARELRQEQSPPEAVFWSRVRMHRLHGLQFRRQQPIGPYVADFYCAAAKMVVELDGRTHRTRMESDRVRDAWMHARGLLVVRVPVWKLSRSPDTVVRAIGIMALQRVESLRAAQR